MRFKSVGSTENRYEVLTEAEILLNAKSGTTDSAWQAVTTVMGRKRSLSIVDDPWVTLFAD